MAGNDADSDAFVLVSQISWEREVIWDSDLVRQKVLKTLQRPSIAGWIPIEERRTAPDFIKRLEITNSVSDAKVAVGCANREDNSNNKPINGYMKNSRKRKRVTFDDECQTANKKPSSPLEPQLTIGWVSTLPEENRDLIGTVWEDKVIWDAQDFDIPSPESNFIYINGDDDNIIVDPFLEDDSNDSVIEEMQSLCVNLNISDDEFYSMVNKSDTAVTHSHQIIHSAPALRLHPLCFPYCIQSAVRPLLTRSRYLSSKVAHIVSDCTDDKSDENKGEGNQTQTSNHLNKCPLTVGELTARTGKIVLMELSEEDPPLMMRVGMGSKIFNYYNIVILFVIFSIYSLISI